MPKFYFNFFLQQLKKFFYYFINFILLNILMKWNKKEKSTVLNMLTF